VTKRGYEVAVAFEFFFDCSSPWTYLACGRVQRLANRTVANLVLRPVLRRGVFNKVNANVDENRKPPTPTRPWSAIQWLIVRLGFHRMWLTLRYKAPLDSNGSAWFHLGKPCDDQGFARFASPNLSCRRDDDVMNCHKARTALGDQKQSLAKARMEDKKLGKTNDQIFASKACSKTHADFVAPRAASGHSPLDVAEGVRQPEHACVRLISLETRLRAKFANEIRKMVNGSDDRAEVAAREIGTQKMEESSWA
jgi:hypothetical protein